MAVERLTLTEAEIADDEAEGKSIASTRKIGLGVKKLDLEKVLGKSFNGDNVGSQAGDTEHTGETLEETLDRKYPGVPGSGRDAIGGGDRALPQN